MSRVPAALTLVLIGALGGACDRSGLPGGDAAGPRGPDGPAGPDGEPAGDPALLALQPARARLDRATEATLSARGVRFDRDGAVVDAGPGVTILHTDVLGPSTLRVAILADTDAAQGWRPIRVVSGRRTLALDHGLELVATLDVVSRRPLAQGSIATLVLLPRDGEPPLFTPHFEGDAFGWGAEVTRGLLPSQTTLDGVVVAPDAPTLAPLVVTGAASQPWGSSSALARLVSAPLPIAPRRATLRPLGASLSLDGADGDSLDGFALPGPGIAVVTIENAVWAAWPGSPRYASMVVTPTVSRGATSAAFPVTAAEPLTVSTLRTGLAAATLRADFFAARLVGELPTDHGTPATAQPLDPTGGPLVLEGTSASGERDHYALVVGTSPVELSLRASSGTWLSFIDEQAASWAVASSADGARAGRVWAAPGLHVFFVQGTVAGQSPYRVGLRVLP